MDTLFAQALVPKTFRCMGRDLLPLSVGHHALLDVLDSPFLSGQPVSRADLAVGVYVCSLPFREAQARLRDEKTAAAECRAWGRSAGRTFNPVRAAGQFRRYVQHYTRMPELFASDQSGKVNAPLTFALLYILQNTFNLTEEESWNLPLNEALCRSATVQDMSGAADIMTDYDQLLGERAEALQRRLDALLAKETAGG